MAGAISENFRGGLAVCVYILTLSLLSVACSSNKQPQSQAAAEVRIGYIITNSEDRIRTSSWNLLDMFQNKISGEQGFEVAGKRHPVTFVIKEIDGGIPEQAVRVVKELINQEKVTSIIGPHYSIDAIPAAEVTEKAGIPLISPTSTHPDTTAGKKYVFRTAFIDEFQAKAMARFCVLDLRAENIAVLFNMANPYSRGLADAFRQTVIQEGGRISSYESYVTGESVFTSQLERIANNRPDALYLPNFSKETETIVVQARDLGIGAVLLGVDSWDSPKFLTMDHFNGAYLTGHMSPGVLKGKPKELFDEYQTRYGLEFDDGSALACDSISILLAAIQHADSFEPEAIRDTLYDLGPYQGVAGVIDFVDSGDPEREAVILRFEKGRTKLVKRIKTGREEGTGKK